MMTPLLAHSWSAHYARLAASSRDDEHLPGQYSLVLPTTTSAGTCRENLISVPDCVAMLITPSGRVKLLHLPLRHISEPTRLRRNSYAVF